MLCSIQCHSVGAYFDLSMSVTARPFTTVAGETSKPASGATSETVTSVWPEAVWPSGVVTVSRTV